MVTLEKRRLAARWKKAARTAQMSNFHVTFWDNFFDIINLKKCLPLLIFLLLFFYENKQNIKEELQSGGARNILRPVPPVNLN